MPRITMADLAAQVAALTAALAAAQVAPAAPSEASQHFADRDLPCTFAEPCERTFRTAKGQAWHRENMAKAHSA